MAMPPKQGRQWNSTLPSRKTGLRRTAFQHSGKSVPTSSTRRLNVTPKIAKRSSGLGSGKRTKQWDADRRKLKIAFQLAGITTCELRLPGCWRDNGLGFAHSKKRRFVITEADREHVALACNACHDIIESKDHGGMMAAVITCITARIEPVQSIFDKIEVGA